jgi:ubiquitin carboxyl-terminal hydrolase 16
MAKVSFPEVLPLGGLLDRKVYRLLGVVAHKGSHNSGHYESFRRQILSPPFSTPTSMGTEGLYSRKLGPTADPQAVIAKSPCVDAKHEPSLLHSDDENHEHSVHPEVPSGSNGSLLPEHSSDSQDPELRSRRYVDLPTPGLSRLSLDATSMRRPQSSGAQSNSTSKSTGLAKLRGASSKNKAHDRWWRISDDKIKESKTSEVLGMQREVYLLFYERMVDK